MQNANPYRSPNNETIKQSARMRARKRWILIGFALGASVPMAFGMYGIQQHYIYISTLGPNEAACGMGALGALAMIFVVGPFLDTIGAVSGWIASEVDWWFTP